MVNIIELALLTLPCEAREHYDCRKAAPVFRRRVSVLGWVQMRWLSVFNTIEWAFLIFNVGMMVAGVLFIIETVLSPVGG